LTIKSKLKKDEEFSVTCAFGIQNQDMRLGKKSKNCYTFKDKRGGSSKGVLNFISEASLSSDFTSSEGVVSLTAHLLMESIETLDRDTDSEPSEPFSEPPHSLHFPHEQKYFRDEHAAVNRIIPSKWKNKVKRQPSEFSSRFHQHRQHLERERRDM